MGRTLKFGDLTREPDVRMLSQMERVVMDTDWYDSAANRPLYYMYRDLYKPDDKQAVRDADVRYDITVIPPGSLGREYVKTKGHYHPEAERGKSYPEIYEVIAGKGHYLLQRRDEEGEIDDVILVEASAGDKVIIPPDYGHITINPSDDELVMANWVSSEFDSVYRDIEEKRGGAYYETIAGELVANDSYEDVPAIRRLRPVEVPDLGIEKEEPMYRMIDSPGTLRFLNHPAKFSWVFQTLLPE